MAESFILGFRDLFRNKRLFILFEVSLLAICLIFISAIDSLLWDLNLSSTAGGSSPEYIAIPISNDMSSNAQLVNETNRLLHKGGKTFFYSEQWATQTGHPTAVVIDSAFNESVGGERQYAKIYASPGIKEKMDLANMHFPEPAAFESTNMNGFDERLFDSFYKDEVVIILLKTNRLDKWIETAQGLEIIELAENVRFSEPEKQKGLAAEFEAIFADSFLSLYSNSSQSNEARFILLYVFPTAAFVIVSLILALIIMYDSLFKKLYREYAIHLISGGTFKHIYARNSVFIVTLFSVCLLIISFLNHFEINRLLGIALAILFLIFSVFEILLYLFLKRKNVSLTLKGDD
jgi:hypothetical protein